MGGLRSRVLAILGRKGTHMKKPSIHTPSATQLGHMTLALAALVLLPGCDQIGPAPAFAQTASTGQTTRYWDCCKVSSAWPGKITSVAGKGQVASCAKNGSTLVDPNVQSVCGGGGLPGPSYMCSKQQPWTVSTNLSYGFAAAALVGKSEADISCACYSLQFTSGALTGKTFVVQVVNQGADLGSNHFDFLIPGGGVGVFNGCTPQWAAPANGWGQQYGGVSSKSECSQLPAALRPGCNWRFDWLQNANNPAVNFKRIKCPTAITDRTSCIRADDASQPTQ